MELTEKQERVKKIISYFENYVVTYKNQKFYLDYSDETIIDDMIYGLGISFNKEKYSYMEGYKKFKTRLILYLLKRTKKIFDNN